MSITLNTVQLIQPAEVTRDEEGMWCHPDFPDTGEEEYIPTGNGQSGLIAKRSWPWSKLLSLMTPHRILSSYFPKNDDLTAVAKWNPRKPDGGGWFLLYICDTEDGPTSLWVTREVQS